MFTTILIAMATNQMLKKQKGTVSLRARKAFAYLCSTQMKKDNRIYKVATWIIILLFAMLQPLGQYESLPDDVTSFDNCEMQFCQQGSTCIDEDTTPYAPSATRLRHQTTSVSGPSVIQRHVSSLSACSGRKTLCTPSADYIRRRSTLCIYRL